MEGRRMRDDMRSQDREYYFDRKEKCCGGTSSRHSHELCEIYYMRDGGCTYSVGESTYELSSGDIIIIPAGVVHSATYGTRPYTRLLLNFPVDSVSPGLRLVYGERALFFHTGHVQSLVDSAFEGIEREYGRGDAFSIEGLRIYTEQLLLILARNNDATQKNAQRDGIIDAAVRYIHSNYATDVRLSRVAELVSVSPEHLCRTFKRTMGVGFNEYLTDCRLRRAEYMIKNEPGRTIGEIAYACGFNDSNYFSYKFRERYGIPPTKFRGGAATLNN